MVARAPADQELGHNADLLLHSCATCPGKLTRSMSFWENSKEPKNVVTDFLCEAGKFVTSVYHVRHSRDCSWWRSAEAIERTIEKSYANLNCR